MAFNTKGVQIKVTADTTQAKRDLAGLEASVASIEKTATSVTRSFQRLALGIAAVFTTSSFGKSINSASDSIINLENQLALVVGRGKELQSTLQQVREAAGRSRASVSATATTFNRFGLALRDSGKSVDELLVVTEAVQQAAAISGSGAASAEAAIIQLGQGLASGQLRGQELNSVLEQIPELARTIADGIGIPFEDLRKAAEAGQITSEAVFAAILKGAGKLQIQFDQLEATSEGLVVVLKDELSLAIRNLDKEFLGFADFFKSKITVATSLLRIFNSEVGFLAADVRIKFFMLKGDIQNFIIDVKEIFSTSFKDNPLTNAIGAEYDKAKESLKTKLNETLTISFKVSELLPEYMIPNKEDILSYIQGFTESIAKLFYNLYMAISGGSYWWDIFYKGANWIGGPKLVAGLDNVLRLIEPFIWDVEIFFSDLAYKVQKVWSKMYKDLTTETITIEDLPGGPEQVTQLNLFGTAINSLTEKFKTLKAVSKDVFKNLTTKTIASDSPDGPQEVQVPRFRAEDFEQGMVRIQKSFEEATDFIKENWQATVKFITGLPIVVTVSTSVVAIKDDLLNFFNQLGTDFETNAPTYSALFAVGLAATLKLGFKKSFLIAAGLISADEVLNDSAFQTSAATLGEGLGNLIVNAFEKGDPGESLVKGATDTLSAFGGGIAKAIFGEEFNSEIKNGIAGALAALTIGAILGIGGARAALNAIRRGITTVIFGNVFAVALTTGFQNGIRRSLAEFRTSTIGVRTRNIGRFIGRNIGGFAFRGALGIAFAKSIGEVLDKQLSKDGFLSGRESALSELIQGAIAGAAVGAPFGPQGALAGAISGAIIYGILAGFSDPAILDAFTSVFDNVYLGLLKILEKIGYVSSETVTEAEIAANARQQRATEREISQLESSASKAPSGSETQLNLLERLATIQNKLFELQNEEIKKRKQLASEEDASQQAAQARRAAIEQNDIDNRETFNEIIKQYNESVSNAKFDDESGFSVDIADANTKLLSQLQSFQRNSQNLDESLGDLVDKTILAAKGFEKVTIAQVVSSPAVTSRDGPQIESSVGSLVDNSEIAKQVQEANIARQAEIDELNFVAEAYSDIRLSYEEEVKELQAARDKEIAAIDTSLSAQEKAFKIAEINARYQEEIEDTNRGLADSLVSLETQTAALPESFSSLNIAIADLIDKVNLSGSKLLSLPIQPSQYLSSGNQQSSGSAPFASGGYISGPGSGTSDDIPAMLSNGEYVIKAASVKKFGTGFMDAINSGRVPEKRAMGGLLGNISTISGLVGETRNTAWLGAALSQEDSEINKLDIIKAGTNFYLSDKFNAETNSKRVKNFFTGNADEEVYAAGLSTIKDLMENAILGISLAKVPAVGVIAGAIVSVGNALFESLQGVLRFYSQVGAIGNEDWSANLIDNFTSAYSLGDVKDSLLTGPKELLDSAIRNLGSWFGDWVAGGKDQRVRPRGGDKMSSDFSLTSIGNYATGGAIRGPGSGTSDDIPAMLSNGEYVIRASAVKKFGSGFMDMINQGIMPKFFSEGGFTTEELAKLKKYNVQIADAEDEIRQAGTLGNRESVIASFEKAKQEAEAQIRKIKANAAARSLASGDSASTAITDSITDSITGKGSNLDAFSGTVKQVQAQLKKLGLDQSAALFGPEAIKIQSRIKELSDQILKTHVKDVAELERLRDLLAEQEELYGSITTKSDRINPVEIGAQYADKFKNDFSSGLKEALMTGDFKSFFGGILDSFTQSIIGAFVDGLTDSLFGENGLLSNMLKNITSFGQTVGTTAIGAVESGVQGAAGGKGGGLSLTGLFKNIGSFFKGIIDFIGSLFGGFSGAAVPVSAGGTIPGGSQFQMLAAGGMVNPQYGKDSVPAILMPGEYVVDSRQTAQMIKNMSKRDQQQQVFNINVSGDISRQTRKEIVKMMPEITSGVNMTNRERGGRR